MLVSSTLSMLHLLVWGLLLLYLAKRVHLLIEAKKKYVNYAPLLYMPFRPLSMLGVLLPKSPFYRVLGFNWDERHSLYKDAPLGTLAICPVLLSNDLLITSSLDAFYQSMALNSDFHKAPNPALDMLGNNVVSTEGETWKRHRRITAPAFNHNTYEHVWNTTVQVYEDMLDKEGWRDVDEIPVTNISNATHKLALFLIAMVGFGIPMSWDEPPREKNGKLSAQRMIFEVATHIVERSMVPKWAYYLGIEKLKQIDEAYERFEEFMHERIAEREEELKKIRAMEGSEAEGLKDIFGRLVNARLSEGKQSLSDREIIGNCFVLTFAGHETSANTLSATLALLALYPDEQEWVYKSIVDVLGERQPTFEDFDKLDGVMACFIEGLRMFPAAYLLDKIASKDTTLTLSRKDNPEVKETIPIKKDTALILDMIGMCYDPKLYPNPEVYNPRRWRKATKASSESAIPTALATQADEITGSSPATTLDGFLGFAYGPRTCLGHKFAKVESVAFLALILREWRVVPVMKDGESAEAWRQRVLKPGFGQALLIGEVPLKLIKRKWTVGDFGSA